MLTNSDFVTLIRTLSCPLRPIDTVVPKNIVSLPNIKAVIFDVYGTMVVSGCGDIGLARDDISLRALESALEQTGFEGDIARAAERGVELFRIAIGLFHEDQRRKGKRFPEVEIRDIWQTVINQLFAECLLKTRDESGDVSQLSIEYEFRVNSVWPMPGIADVISMLIGHDIKLGIVSNAQFFTPMIFDALLNSSIDACGFGKTMCIFSYRYLEAKPSRYLFQLVLDELYQKYRICPEQTLYIGNDIRNDIWPANDLGMRTVLFAGDERSLRLRKDDPQCSNIRSDAIVTSLHQLLEIVI